MKTEKPELTSDEWQAIQFVFTDFMQGDYATAPVILNAAIQEGVTTKQTDSIIFQKPAEAYRAFNFLAADHSTNSVVKPVLTDAEWQELQPLTKTTGPRPSASQIFDQAMQQAVAANQLTGVLFEHPGEAFEGLTYLLAQQ